MAKTTTTIEKTVEENEYKKHVKKGENIFMGLINPKHLDINKWFNRLNGGGVTKWSFRRSKYNPRINDIILICRTDRKKGIFGILRVLSNPIKNTNYIEEIEDLEDRNGRNSSNWHIKGKLLKHYPNGIREPWIRRSSFEGPRQATFKLYNF